MSSFIAYCLALSSAGLTFFLGFLFFLLGLPIAASPELPPSCSSECDLVSLVSCFVLSISLLSTVLLSSPPAVTSSGNRVSIRYDRVPSRCQNSDSHHLIRGIRDKGSVNLPGVCSDKDNFSMSMGCVIRASEPFFFACCQGRQPPGSKGILFLCNQVKINQVASDLNSRKAGMYQ